MHKVRELYSEYKFSMKGKPLSVIIKKIANQLNESPNIILSVLSQIEDL